MKLAACACFVRFMREHEWFTLNYTPNAITTFVRIFWRLRHSTTNTELNKFEKNVRPSSKNAHFLVFFFF